jgi:hypothetical protein
VTFNYSPDLAGLLVTIEEELVARTPEVIAGLKLSEPAYAVFLWYDDSSTLPTMICPELGVGTMSLHGACAAEYDDDRDAFLNCIWRPNQEMDDAVVKARFKDQSLAARCQQAYRLMWAANTTDQPLPEAEDAELLLPFRSMMHRVALRLNDRNWEGILTPTDEFVVLAADTIGYWLPADMAASLPASKRELLRRRQLLFGPE